MTAAGTPITDLSTSSRAVWLALAFVPLVAWSKDAAVAAVGVAALLVLATPAARGAALATILRPAPSIVLAGAFLLWALAAVAWAPAHRAMDWLKAVPVIAAAWVVGRFLARAASPSLARLALAAFGALLALLVVERLTGGFVIGLARTGDSRDRLFDILSPGLVLLSCLVFPAALLLERRVGRGGAGWGLIALCLALGLSYRMDAAPVAIACGCVSYAVVRLWRKPGFILVVAGIAVIAVGWGSIASLAWRNGEQDWLTGHINLNWGYRVEIWNRVHELISEHVWIGHGFDTARIVAQGAGVSFLHPHNGLLQVWLELGLVGVVLFLGWAAAAAWAYKQTDPAPRMLATTAATVTALAVFWLISFGIWQGWWLAAIGLTFCALALTDRINSKPDP